MCSAAQPCKRFRPHIALLLALPGPLPAQMENISAFLSALPSFGVRPEDTFQTADLFEGVNMAAVG